MWHDIQILWIKWTMLSDLDRWVVAFYAMQVADAISTYVAIKMGGSEGNPLAKKIMAKLGVIPTLVGGKALVCASIYYNAHLIDPRLLMLLTVFYLGVVAWNTKQIVELRKRSFRN